MNLATNWPEPSFEESLDENESRPASWLTTHKVVNHKGQKYLISPARLDQTDELLRMEGQLFHTDNCSRKSFVYLIRRQRIIVLQDERRDDILGYTTLLTRKNSKKMRIYSFGIIAEARGLGLGSLLLGEIEEKAKIGGFTTLTLEVGESNLPALGLYKRNGFRQCGFRLNYYEDDSHAILMKKVISHSSATL